jgi:hypothetical protein
MIYVWHHQMTVTAPAVTGAYQPYTSFVLVEFASVRAPTGTTSELQATSNAAALGRLIQRPNGSGPSGWL